MASTLWLARDKNGILMAYASEPDRCTEYFAGTVVFYPDDEDYPEVTWENSPFECELKIKEK